MSGPESQSPEGAPLPDPVLPGPVLIIGLGMIGGSIARSLRARVPAQRILALDADRGAVMAARADGVVDDEIDASMPLPAGSLVVLAVPVLRLPAICDWLVARLPASTASGTRADRVVVTDVGSVKQPLIEAVTERLGALPDWLVPGHPIAGSERVGYGAAQEGLFRGRRVLLTPTGASADWAQQRVRTLWTALGAQVDSVDAPTHDAVLGLSSHLPHALAFALMHQLADAPEVFRFSAGGLAEFTRISGSDPRMWHDIFVANDRVVRAALADFRSALDELDGLIAGGGGEALLDWLAAVRDARARALATAAETSR